MMSNVPYLAAHRDKKAGKEECFNIIRRMASGHAVTEPELASLYSYFLPPKPKKITDPFEFAAFACDDKANYSFCKYVESANGCIAAANTKSTHIVMSDFGMSHGFYDTGRGYAGDDVAIMPDYMTAMFESMGTLWSDFDLEKLEIVDTPSGMVYVMPWDGKGVPKEYMDVVCRSIDDMTVMYSGNGSFCMTGKVKKVTVYAVVMPGVVNRI